MNLEEYQKKALLRLNLLIANNIEECINYALLGIGEETGEIIGEIRKSFYKGNYHERKFENRKLAKELGDVVWYIALICKNNKIDINKIQKEQSGKRTKGLCNRKKMIKLALNIEELTGKVVEESINGNLQMLENTLKKEYIKVEEIANEIGITMEEIFEQNIQKINGRYDKRGKVKKENEREER